MDTDYTPKELNQVVDVNEVVNGNNDIIEVDYSHQSSNSSIPSNQTDQLVQKQYDLQNISHNRETDFVESYDFNEAICLKTSERILDDLRSDPLFLMNNEDGIMSLPTRLYSKKRSLLAYNSPIKYETVFWKTDDGDLGSYQTAQLDDGYSLASFSGLVVPNKLKPNFADEKIFHYSLKIKFKNDRVNVKNTFYGFRDEQLKENDKLFINAQTILEDANGLSTESIDILLRSLPKLVDSANFISKETGTIIRLELYPAILEPSELETFNITEIQTRIATFNSQQDTIFDKVGLTPDKCFRTLNSALFGNLKQKNNTEIKTIDLQLTKLQVSLDI
ncbi:hypothetical protein CANINC_000746, partial [Pichia inconspicua]